MERRKGCSERTANRYKIVLQQDDWSVEYCQNHENHTVDQSNEANLHNNQVNRDDEMNLGNNQVNRDNDMNLNDQVIYNDDMDLSDNQVIHDHDVIVDTHQDTIEDHSSELQLPQEETISENFDVLASVMDDISENENIFPEPKTLKEFVESNEFWQTINVKSNKTSGEVFMMILKYSVTYNLSTTARINLFKLVNTIFEAPVVPNSKHMVDKFLNSEEKVEFHAVCSECSTYIGKYDENLEKNKCDKCSEDLNLADSCDDSYFLLIDPSTEFADTLEAYDEHYNYVVNFRVPSTDCIEDIYDGDQYKEFQNKLPLEKRSRYVTTSFNTDGAVKFENSKHSIWPIYLMVNELPKEDRLKKLICCGLWFNRNKPFMSTYLQKFVNLFNEVSERGFECNIKQETRRIYPYILTAVLDSVARAPVQGLKQFNGDYGSRSNNSYAMLKDGSYIVIDEFIVDKVNKKELTICREVSTIDSLALPECNNYKKMRVIRKISKEQIIIETETIAKVCIYMNVDNKKYVCSVPNLIHY
ncbi:hypothetical protein TKK_0015515 [Trichogramma kaykai]